MKKLLAILLLFVSIIFAEYNDTVVNYIFENRNVLQKYFQDSTYNPLGFLLGKESKRENIWQRESLFTFNANIASYYKHKKEIISSLTENRKLMIEPVYFDIVLPLIKAERLDISILRSIPMDVLAKNKKSIENLLNYFINRDSLRWKEEQYIDKYDYAYKGYAQYATLSQLDNIYNYKMIPLWDSYVKGVLVNCIENYDEFQKKRFINATEFLKIINTCSNESNKLKEKAVYYIENTTDSGIVHFVDKSYSKEIIINDFLENPTRINISYIRYLGDTSIISELLPHIISIKEGRETDFAYFKPIYNLLMEFYHDFNLKEKYFRPSMSYDFLFGAYCQECHNNRPFSELYSESYMYYMMQYEIWIKKKFRKELKRKPQPNDIIDKRPGLIH